MTWFCVLWVLSSQPQDEGVMPIFPMADKVMHFGYFLGGSGLLSACFFLRNPVDPNWKVLFLSVVLILGLVGLGDEIHQSYVPGRSGNDPYDWFADLMGAVVGVWVFNVTHGYFKWKS